MLRGAGVVVVAILALVGCSGSSEVEADGQVAEGADAIVAAAISSVLGDEPFRSRTSGGTPFSDGGLDGIYEQSGGDLLDISLSGSYGSATAIVGETAYEWNGPGQSWTETPIDTFDPLIQPGFGFSFAIASALDYASDWSESAELPKVTTGWTEIVGADGRRRFERALPSDMFIGTAGQADDAPPERREKDAIIEAFYEDATLTAIVELDGGGNLARYTVRSEFDGSPRYPDCGPLAKVTGVAEQSVEFSDVGEEFNIVVPEPVELIAQFPLFGEQPNFPDEPLDTFDEPFTNEAGVPDLSGCPPA